MDRRVLTVALLVCCASSCTPDDAWATVCVTGETSLLDSVGTVDYCLDCETTDGWQAVDRGAPDAGVTPAHVRLPGTIVVRLAPGAASSHSFFAQVRAPDGQPCRACGGTAPACSVPDAGTGPALCRIASGDVEAVPGGAVYYAPIPRTGTSAVGLTRALPPGYEPCD